jgi:hypothetical protein
VTVAIDAPFPNIYKNNNKKARESFSTNIIKYGKTLSRPSENLSFVQIHLYNYVIAKFLRICFSQWVV